MSLFEEEKQDSLDVFRFLYFNRKAIIYAFIVGGIIAGAVSFMLPKKYKSTGILYPPNSYVRDRLIENPQFGHELEVEHLIQILESSNVRDSVIAQFNLAAYYDVDTSSVQWKDKLNEYYISDVSFQRSPYISVIIEATFEDPELAANIVNYIIDIVNRQKETVFKDNIQRELNYFRTRYEAAQQKSEKVIERIYILKDTTISKNLISNYLSNLSKEGYVDNEFISSKELENLVRDYRIYEAQMLERKRDYEQALDAVNKPFLHNYVVEYAAPNYKKVFPKNTINALIGAFIAAIGTVAALAWKKKVESIR